MKKYLVIGNPIEHSLSPRLHNHWIKKNNIDAIYDKKQLNEGDIEGIISEVRNEKIQISRNHQNAFKSSCKIREYWCNSTFYKKSVFVSIGITTDRKTMKKTVEKTEIIDLPPNSGMTFLVVFCI